MKRYVTMLAAGAALLLAILAPAAVLANGVPQLVKLTYLEDLSNYGPTDAEGVLEFSFAEAYAKVDVTGLPALPAGQVYEGWLVKTATNESISIGTFNTDAAGAAQYETNLPTVQDYGYDLFIITVEDEAGDAAPSDKRSIGGYFTVVNRPGAADAGGPDTLPNTGDGDVMAAVARMALVGGAVAVGLGAAFVAARRRRTA